MSRKKRKNYEVLNEKNPDYPGKITGRNKDAKGASGEISQRNEGYDTGNWRKGNPCYTGVENLADLYCTGQKVELDIQLRRLLSKVSKCQPGFSLLLIIKCESREIS